MKDYTYILAHPLTILFNISLKADTIIATSDPISGTESDYPGLYQKGSKIHNLMKNIHKNVFKKLRFWNISSGRNIIITMENECIIKFAKIDILQFSLENLGNVIIKMIHTSTQYIFGKNISWMS